MAVLSEGEVAIKRLSASKVRGVFYDPRSDKFVAEVTKGGVRHRLGSFDTAEEAGEAYKAAKPSKAKQRAQVRKAEPQARREATTQPTPLNRDSKDGHMLWSFVPYYLRPSGAWSVASWLDYEPGEAHLRQIAAWQEHSAIWTAKVNVFGDSEAGPVPDYKDAALWRAEAARRNWPPVVLAKGPEDADESAVRFKARVAHWEAYLRRTGAAGVGLIDMLATTLPGEGQEASAAEFSDLV